MTETWLYLALTVLTFGGGRLSGIPFDPDRTFQLAGPSCYQQRHVNLRNVGTLTYCDKLAHASGGIAIVFVSVALDHHRRGDNCFKSAFRGVMRAQVASAFYEAGIALTTRKQWGQPGYGLGLLDHLAVTGGSVVAGAIVCAVW